ncbi:coatomer WD associated region-domain-containing protein [Dunaliella salina]|uniref:Beta'-coat protein n=1 Tax=Dunaliella salina TaxID=3046 RepID=A0ABQ7GWY8_DUNSA|nr:coatomer WD associated region-domain-containing protein [Dunaliella salina]|eukprot:KAF5839138.1 coatomer WD associated region-domain-containing protein [Dunaliella salina]
MKFEIKRQLLQRTDRVKGVELHPSEPWLMANLYNGNVLIYNYTDTTLVKSFEVTEQPVRAAKFVARKQWVVTGSDDMLIRVYNYNTMDKIKVFEAHTDYIRCIAVHPTLPAFLTSSDDTLIKLWDWDKGFACVQQFEGHSHFVMQVTFNPKDNNTFASASLDRSIKVWSLGQPMPNFTLEGHDKGVNCLDYFSGSDRPYLISGADDKLIKIWDYQTKACVQTLEGHSHNIAAVCLHPELPLIVSGSEDGTIKLWHSTTYRLETTLDYRMERVWGLGYLKGSNSIAIAYDDGTVMIKVGREEPVASMDSSGKIIWARHNEIQTVNIKALGSDYEMQDGERLPLAVKDLGSSDLYPQSLQHNPNGRFVTVCGDGEFVVYTALAWRNKSFGPGLEFVWSNDSNEYAIRESPTKVKLYKNFQEKTTLKLDFNAEGIFGGSLVGVKSGDYIVFYDWEGNLVRRVDAVVRGVYWSEGGTQVAVVSDDSFYLLQYNADVVDAALAAGGSADPDGIDDAFELIAEVNERVKTGVWVGDCFIYNTASWRLNYCVGGEVTTMYHLDRPMYLLGYLASLNRVFLVDKDFGIVSYTLLLSMVEFKTLCMRGDVGTALTLLPQLPKDQGELAMTGGHLGMAQQCLVKAKDYSGLLLMRSVTADRKGLEGLAVEAREAGKHNVAFVGLFLLGRMQECVELLVESGR